MVIEHIKFNGIESNCNNNINLIIDDNGDNQVDIISAIYKHSSDESIDIIHFNSNVEVGDIDDDEIEKFCKFHNKEQLQYLIKLIPFWKDIEIVNDKMQGVINDKIVKYENLNEGFKKYVSMCCDILYKYHYTNDIIIIENIEYKLHPNFQRYLIPNLKEVFSNKQFFITTYSPHIVQSVKLNQLINLTSAMYIDNPIDLSLEDVSGLMNVESVFSIYTKDKYEFALGAIKYLNQLPNEITDEDRKKYWKEYNKILTKYAADPGFMAILKLKGYAKIGSENK